MLKGCIYEFCLGLYFLIHVAALGNKLANAQEFDKTPFLRPKNIPFRVADKYTIAEREKLIELGRNLFFDPRLSRNGLMSCATCHNPSFYWTDALKTSVENASLRSMSLYNLAWDKAFTWNGRAGSLTSQAILPLMAPKGMNSDNVLISERISAIPYYREGIGHFGKNPKTGEPVIDISGVAFALEFFISTILSPVAPFDHWIEGKSDAISPAAIRGFELFRNKAGCVNCHSGWRFSDGGFYDIGLAVAAESNGIPNAVSPFFKAVGLRNIADRPPYMHDGSFATLSEVVDFYNRGGDTSRPSKSPKIKQLNLSESEKSDIIEFLQSLSGRPESVEIPLLPR